MTYNPKLWGEVLQVGSSSSETESKLNDSASNISKADPICTTALGGVKQVDASSEFDAFAIIGVAKSAANIGQTFQIVTQGKLEDVSITGSVGDPIYVSKTGDLINIKPSIGVSGFVESDFIIRIGVLVRNASNPLKKDLIVNLKIIGQL